MLLVIDTLFIIVLYISTVLAKYCMIPLSLHFILDSPQARGVRCT